VAEKFSLDLTHDPKVIAGTRIFDAPRALVFSAWTEPRHFAQWWGPTGFSTTTQAFDFRPGGVWRFVMHGPDGRDYQNRITFDEIVPPERIAYHHGGGDDVEPVQFKTVVTFEDLGGKTKLSMHATFPSAEERDRVIREYGADKGQVETLARLADYVAGMAKVKTDASDDDFVISRTFDAPRALVWKVWTEAEHLAQWWGPKGCSIRVVKLDVRPGGMFHYAMAYQPGHDMWGRFVYREIVPPERMVYVSSFSDAQGGITRAPFPQLRGTFPLEILNTLTLSEVGGKTTMTVRGRPLNATQEERKAYRDMFGSMQQGFSGTFDHLAQYLAKLQGSL
jgi:uncharacterized protein YndB with AHSA1/START domain